LLFPNSYIIPFWEFYFLPFSVYVKNQRNLFNLIVSVIVVFLSESGIGVSKINCECVSLAYQKMENVTKLSRCLICNVKLTVMFRVQQ
jgi:hypothetical protein